MAKKNRYDLIVIGAGPGGYVAAIRAAQLGLSVALVDRRPELGGACLNVGCIPSKALLDSSELYHRCRGEAKDHGLLLKGLELDLAAMMKRKDQVVSRLTSGIGFIMKKRKITVIQGEGRVLAAGRVEVEPPDGGARQTLEADAILLATGSVPQELSFLPMDGKRIVSSTEALSFDAVPSSLLVVGAGAIGLELGSVWLRLGSKVTVLEIMPEILPGWDGQLAAALRKELTGQGFVFELGTRVEGVSIAKSGKVTLKAVDKQGQSKNYKGDRVLAAVGRKPFTEGLELEKLGIELDESGCIRVSDTFETTAAHIYAIGDVITGPMLAHKAEEEGIAFAEKLVGKAGHVNYDTMPGLVYTEPEGAFVGKTEQQLKEQGISYARGTFSFAANGRAIALNAAAGFAKILADRQTDRVLGVHIVGPRASELIAEAVTVMEFGGSAEDIGRTVHSHPTLSETVREAALAVDRRAIHSA